jgi:hypothetical protein
MCEGDACVCVSYLLCKRLKAQRGDFKNITYINDLQDIFLKTLGKTQISIFAFTYKNGLHWMQKNPIGGRVSLVFFGAHI